jgi:7-keto-8-aminopelargonate synthetase-like enzyme
MKVRLIPSEAAHQYEEKGDLGQFETKEILNCASNNYGGFSRLEYNTASLMQEALLSLPFAPAPPRLESLLEERLASFMEFDVCALAPSGFSTNILAFSAVAEFAKNSGRNCVFLCDRDCHNSMFTGAYMNKDAKTHKFDHNDLTDLEFKLRAYREQDPKAMICVAIEGIYRYVIFPRP